MLTIGVLAGRDCHGELIRQLSPIATIVWCERADQLVELVAENEVDAAVTELRDETGRSIAPAVVELAALRPALPVIVQATATRASLDELFATFALGLRLEAAVRPFAALEPLLRHMLTPAYRPGVAPVLQHHLMPHVPASLYLFVALAILSASTRRSVEELASWCGVSLRTVERRLRSAGWPAAQAVLRSFTALDAVWLMTEYGWSARRVHQVRGLPHPSSVTRLLARYTGTRPATVIADGGFPAALEHVLHALLMDATRPAVAPV